MGTNETPHPPTVEVAHALNSIRRLVRALRTSASDTERRTGLSAAQVFVLQLLEREPAESMNDLAARTMTDQSSVSVVVTRLQAKGFVTREPSKSDARRTRVVITDAGRAVLSNQPQTVQTRLIRALETLEPHALVQLHHHLTRVIGFIGAADEPATMFFEDDATGTS